MSIRLKLLITFMAIAIIPMLLVSALSFYGAQKSLREASLNDLRALAAAKKIAVLEYLSGKKGRTIDFASDGFIRDQAELIAKSADSKERIQASRLLNTHLKINKKPLDEEIVEIRVLDLKRRHYRRQRRRIFIRPGYGKKSALFFRRAKQNLYPGCRHLYAL